MFYPTPTTTKRAIIEQWLAAKADINFQHLGDSDPTEVRAHSASIGLELWANNSRASLLILRQTVLGNGVFLDQLHLRIT